MRRELLRTSVLLVLTFLGAVGTAAAQQSPAAEPQQEQPPARTRRGRQRAGAGRPRGPHPSVRR